MSERKRISRTLTSRKVIGSANPVARYGRQAKSTCFDTIGGFFFGILLFFVPFGLTYCSATTEKDSKDISRIEVIQADQAAGISGKALVSGQVTPTETLQPPFGNPTGTILAFEHSYDKWVTKTVTRQETETRIENGQEVEYTYDVDEEVSDWEAQQHSKRWSPLKLGPVSIDPNRCDVQIPWVSIYHEEYVDALGDKYRDTVEVVYPGSQALLAAEFENGAVIDSPDFFILTNKGKDELVAQLNRQEETSRWALLVLAVILMTVSLNLIIGPALLIINLIPVKALSGAVRGIVTFVALILSIAIVGATYMFVRYWWVIILLLVGIAIWVIIEANKKKQENLDDIDLDDLDMDDQSEAPEPGA